MGIRPFPPYTSPVNISGRQGAEGAHIWIPRVLQIALRGRFVAIKVDATQAKHMPRIDRIIRQNMGSREVGRNIPKTGECAQKSDADVAHEISMLLIRILQIITYSIANPSPRIRPRRDSNCPGMHAALGMRGNGKFQRGLQDMPVCRRVTHVQTRVAAFGNSQRRPHVAREIRPDVEFLQILANEIQDFSGQFRRAPSHFVNEGGRDATEEKKTPAAWPQQRKNQQP